MHAAAPPVIADIRAAADRLAGHALPTPLLSSPFLDGLVGGRVLLKCEGLQRTGSFKFRGAYNAIAAMSAGERAAGVVAASSGNHAQGVAEAARLFGLRATIVMPADAPRIKQERTQRSGARIVSYDRGNTDRDEVVAEVIARDGGTLVHPFNDAAVIAGQGTIGIEIAAECNARGLQPDVVVLPCAGGGLSAGVRLALRDSFPEVAVMLVEPEDFDDYGRSLAGGQIVANSRTAGSVLDSLLSPSPGALGFAVHSAAPASAACTVSDDEALAAVAFAFRELKLVVEPGGAAGLAALLARRIDCRDRTVVVVLSGGNIDDGVLSRALASREASR